MRQLIRNVSFWKQHKLSVFKIAHELGKLEEFNMGQLGRESFWKPSEVLCRVRLQDHFSASSCGFKLKLVKLGRLSMIRPSSSETSMTNGWCYRLSQRAWGMRLRGENSFKARPSWTRLTVKHLSYAISINVGASRSSVILCKADDTDVLNLVTSSWKIVVLLMYWAIIIWWSRFLETCSSKNLAQSPLNIELEASAIM